MATISGYGPLGAGHVNPTLGIVAELVRRGHQVTYWAPSMFAERITETGAKFEPVDSLWERLPGGPPQMHGKELVRAMGLLLDETKAMVPRLAGAPAPDLVLHDGPLAWWGRILAHRWGVPAVETWPNFVGNKHWSMANYAKINPASPRFLWQLLRLGRYLRGQGIREVAKFTQGQLAAARIVTLPRAFQYAGDTFHGWDFVGPCLTGRGYQDDWTPPGNDLPVLLVSLGTAYNARPDFYRMIVESAAEQPWHVVLATGDQVRRAELGRIPDNVEVHEQVPQLAVLRHARAFVTHAGMGSTMEAIHQRVPLVAVPQMAEQRANADRIAELGLGHALDPATVDADALWKAANALAGDVDVRDRLTTMRAEMDTAGGASAAGDIIERILAES
ncbi:MGT family glycosyltransferase [Tamaricihabitans halophyticus]|uniref:MGT family glycosyltransferase n=1 Tax=Tamaricihabitans halophyticus TaxID=1262583 RepID=A0A4R2R6P2_9PSEU|nr:macrolide family glycosyltransferase [Tamaricihabitans halophyticus]TCP55005.1 MGT family glycosyltransferase [Tamaricihabitans halophyticus]